MVKENVQTNITITKGDGEMIIHVKGHHKDHVVCAGISAIMETCRLGLTAVSRTEKGVKITEKEI